MKKTLLSIILLFSIHLLVAQAYVPFPSHHAGWKDVYNCTENNYFTAGDTIINQLVYHKIFVFGYNFNRNILTGICSPFSKTPFPQRYVGAFRNDTSNKKVYFIPVLATSDTLLYDFDLNLGDTLDPHYKLKDSAKSNLLSFWVYDIDSIQSGGIWRKRFKLKGGDSLNTGVFDIDLIEGIGSTQSFLDPYTHYPYGSGSLECVKDSGQLIFGISSCDLLVGLETQVNSKQEINIYPNPTNGLLFIPKLKQLEHIQLYNIQGKLIEEIQANSSTETTLNIEGPSGIYLLRIQMKDGTVNSTKVIKQ